MAHKRHKLVQTKTTVKMRPILLVLMIFAFVSILCGQDDVWTTFYEKSGKLETPRYVETMAYFKRLADFSPFATMFSFGKSPEGRDLNLFVISADKAFSPEAAHQVQKPIVLIQCCIHPGESEGKDAAMMLARDILVRHRHPDLLRNLIIAIIPIFNVDGHERFGPYNRINQNGPKEMGWRVTATRLNLNRDFIKADAPEMRAWLSMFNQWQPHLFYDCHTTDGADHQYDLTYNIDTHEIYGGAISVWAKEKFLPSVLPKFEALGHIAGPYAGLVDRRHPEKGLRGGVWPPRLSNPYLTLRNRAGILIETHSLKPYSVRVKATYDFLLTGLTYVASHANEVMEAVARTEQQSASLGRHYNPDEKFPLRFKTDMEHGEPIVYHGYRIEVKEGEISGGEYLHYTHEKQDVATTFYNRVSPSITVTPPLGYLIPRQWRNVIDVLKAHGVRLLRLAETVTDSFETYRFSNVKFASSSYEGHQRVSYGVERIVQRRTFRPGDVYVPLGCPEAKIIMQMLEPQAPDALVGWGFMNTIFEQREYFETYVMEPLAEKMAKENPELKRAFEKKLREDKDFAASPRRRLQFFYERSPYWDQEMDVYPIVRVTNVSGLKLIE